MRLYFGPKAGQRRSEKNSDGENLKEFGGKSLFMRSSGDFVRFFYKNCQIFRPVEAQISHCNIEA
jgi:hypothetical protein